MSLLLQEIRKEKLRKSPELGYIQRLQQMHDKSKEGRISFSNFVSTGRIYPKVGYLKKYQAQDDSLHNNTQMVITYMMGIKVDMLFDGTYHVSIPAEKGHTQNICEHSVSLLEKMLYEKLCDDYSTEVAL